MRTRHRHALLLAAIAGTACNGAGPGAQAAAENATSATPSGREAASAPATPITVSGLLLLPADRLAALREPSSTLRSVVRRLLDNADQNLEAKTHERSSVENLALAYLVSGEPKYCRTALRWEQLLMSADVRRDSYLGIGDAMRSAALTLDWCRPTLSVDENRALRDYLARWTEELWFANQGSGWGLRDPGNNYHFAFLEGTAFAGYALLAAGDERGRKYVHLLLDRLHRHDGVFAYLRARLPGGGWLEGTNYGQRAKQRLFAALSVIASTGGTNYFASEPFFANSLRYAVFQTQPGRRDQYPSGDLARDVRSPVSPYDRSYVQTATYWLPDSQARGLGQWYLTHVVPAYDNPAFEWRAGYYLDALYALDAPVVAPTGVAPFYLEAGEGFVHARSGWDDDATSLTLAAPSLIDQSHAHFDAGSFVLYRSGWLVADAGSFSRSGLLSSSAAHSGITVPGAELRYGHKFRGLTRHQAEDGQLYAQVDATGMPVRRDGDAAQELLEEHTRELLFLMPDDVVVYDRVRPKSGEKGQWRAHFATRPEAAGGELSVANDKAAVRLSILIGDGARVVSDEDLESSAFRVEVDPVEERVLAVFRTARGEPPADGALLLASVGEISAVLAGDQVVVLSSQPFGKPASLPFSYAVPGTAERWHTIVNLGEPVEVVAAQEPRGRRITVRGGGNEKPSQAGLVRVRR